MKFFENKIKKLAEYLQEPEEDFVEDEDDSNIIDNKKTGESYFVGNEVECYEEACSEIESITDELGLEAFTPNFQEWIIENAIDEGYFAEVLENELEYFTDEEPDDEMVKLINSYENKPAQYFLDEFGRDFVDDMIKNALKEKKDIFDTVAICDECLKWDEIAYFIASYDGKEIDLGDGLYAYRLN